MMITLAGAGILPYSSFAKNQTIFAYPDAAKNLCTFYIPPAALLWAFRKSGS